MAVGFVAASLVTAALAAGGNLLVSSRQTDRAEQIGQVSAFVKSTQDFDPLFKSYMDTVLDGTGNMASARQAVEENLHKQHILLGAADDYLTGSDKAEADAYRKTLVTITTEMRKKTRNPVTGRELMQGVADAVEQRELVIGDLRRSAGLPAEERVEP
jgi:hypothetical protein